MKISASIYSDKKRALQDSIADLVDHQVDLLHVDCNDDVSVFDDIQNIRKVCSLPIDLHIITSNPSKYWDLLRANPVEYVTFQYEDLAEPFEFPSDILGQKGLAIITPTSIDVFDAYANLDFILIMATIPGQSGGVFDPVNFKKIRAFRKKFPSKPIHVDGGVNGEVSFILRNMGVYASVSGSFLFNAPSVGKALMDLTKREIDSTFKLKDFMLPQEECPIIDWEELTLKNVLQNIEDGKLGFTIVRKHNRIAGIISNADIRRALLKNMDNIANLNVLELINNNPVLINENKDVNQLLQLVRDVTIPVMYLPVVNDDNEPTGIISFLNLIKGEN